MVAYITKIMAIFVNIDGPPGCMHIDRAGVVWLEFILISDMLTVAV